MLFCIRNPVENDLNSFIQTSRIERAQSMMSHSPRINSYYQPQGTTFETRSEINFNTPGHARAYSPEDLQKMRYKIDLG